MMQNGERGMLDAGSARLLAQLRAYEPVNEQEAADRDEMVRRLACGEELWTRENRSAHLTASAWVTSPCRERVLLCYHRIYDSWAWLGGHADGQRDLLGVALREVGEESGLTRLRPVMPGFCSVEILCVDGHEKRGAYVSSHLHLNVTYLIEADPSEPLRVKEDENAALGWFSPEEAIAKSSEPWFRERIYPKLNARLRSCPRG